MSERAAGGVELQIGGTGSLAMAAQLEQISLPRLLVRAGTMDSVVNA